MKGLYLRPRNFIWFMGPAAYLLAALLPPAIAQDGAKPRRVGWISTQYEEAGRQLNLARPAFADLGYHEGKNFILDMRYAGGRMERGAELAGELLEAGAEILVTGGHQLSAAALRVTQTVPVVGVGCGVEQLAESLARPGGNFTGVECQSSDLVAKHLQLLSQVVAGEQRLATLVNPNSRDASTVTEVIKRAAAELNLVVPLIAVRKPEEIEAAFGEIAQMGIRGTVVAPDALSWGERRRVIAAAATHRMAIVVSYREFGALLSYGNSINDLVRRAVATVDKLLKGAKPADLPMERPTKFELVVNLKTARELGLTIPPSILLRADEVIE
jgi:putative tryptophan/tyrosine transport system substrate-binding protein